MKDSDSSKSVPAGFRNANMYSGGLSRSQMQTAREALCDEGARTLSRCVPTL